MAFKALVKHIPLAMALYSVLAFAGFSTIAQLASASDKPDGIWVQLCATGTQMFIPLPGQNDDDAPDAPASPSHSQGCHACANRRFGANPDDDMPDECA